MSQAFATEGVSNERFGDSEGLVTEGNGDAISEVTEVAGLVQVP